VTGRIICKLFIFLAFCAASASLSAQPLRILNLRPDGSVTWTGAIPGGVCTVETAAGAKSPWLPLLNVFTTNVSGLALIRPSAGHAFYRLLARDLSATSQGFSNLCASYGIIRTVAGKGEFSVDGYNGWDPQFEGGPATDAELSRPHMAMADNAGNIYIADKDGHAIRKVTPAGLLVTVAGTNEPGDDGNSPGPGTQRHLSSPNGLWVRGDGTVYILDLGNSKIRRLDSAGVLTTLFHSSDDIQTGRGLWVAEDESLVYFASGNSLKKWTPGGGVKTVANAFAELGNLVVDPAGNLIVTDRGAHRVYRVSKSGNKTPIAGNGNLDGGGDGARALETALPGVRGVWFLPNGGYLLATHEGSQIWYVDTAGTIHLFVDGAPGAHAGDEQYFRTPGPKVSEVRAVTVDKQGRIIITENDAGFIRVIDFLPAAPGS
jgi:sugar lactone lactonase YvrE